MKKTTERVVSSLKRTKTCSVPTLWRSLSSSAVDGRNGQRPLRLEQRPVVEPRPFEQHQLEQEERAHLAHVVDGLGEPAGELLASLGCRLEERPVRPPRAPLASDRLDQASALEQLERAVHERPADRPHPSDLAAPSHRLREGPAVRGLVCEQREDGPLPRRQLAHFRHDGKGYFARAWNEDLTY